MGNLKQVVTLVHVSLIALLLLTACSGSNKAEPVNSTEPSVPVATESAGPSVRIVSPATGDTIEGDTITVEIEVVGFIMDRDAMGKARVTGRGHWHLSLDGRDLVIDAGNTTTLERVAPGPHNVRVSLRNNDHSTLTPEVDHNINLDVVAAK